MTKNVSLTGGVFMIKIAKLTIGKIANDTEQISIHNINMNMTVNKMCEQISHLCTTLLHFKSHVFNTFTHARTHTHARTQARTRAHTRTHARTHTRAHARKHTHTHAARTHTHTHTHTLTEQITQFTHLEGSSAPPALSAVDKDP